MPQYLSNLPIGALIKFGNHKVGSEDPQPIVWIVADKNHSGYPANSVSLITQKIIDLRAYNTYKGDEESEKSDPEYPESTINQWLNSSAASNWFVKDGSNHQPPDNTSTQYNTGYVDRPGFLYNFTAAERLAILPTTHTFPIQHLDGSYTTAVCNVFLPSLREVLGVTTVDDKTSRLQYFVSNAVTCGLTSQAYTNTSSTNKPTTIDSHWNYFTRSAAYSDVYSISNTGLTTNISTRNGSAGIRPMVNLSDKTKISDTMEDGCYTVLTQVPPVISGSNTDLGEKNEGFIQTYIITDADNDPVTVTEYIDNVKVNSYVATLDATNSIAVTGTTWLKLTNGVHTLKITATDGFDESSRIITFTKSVTKLVVQRVTPFDSSNRASSVLVNVVKVLPAGATMKIEACNNGYDDSPTWETIVEGVISPLRNETKSASQWGINVRVTVDRNGASGACYITEIGGNFE